MAVGENKEQILNVKIEDEIKTSYLNYAMSVIVSRALPDVRDGLKPVHRRILYSMYEMGLRSDKAFKKAGRIVGDVLGKYHPHGDQSIYDALVRLAQDFSLRYPVIRGQGNFGSIDGDPPAAMRYTEAKMEKITEYIVKDIEKETVNFKSNYDDSLSEPEIMPSSFPFLLVNGSSGIAVGMATNMAPHNLREICDAIVYMLDNENASIFDLLKIVKGPDFPTFGEIVYNDNLIKAYKTGKGSVVIRARYHIEERAEDRNAIIVTEIPYTVNKSALLMKVALLAKEEKLEGLLDIRDESDREGIRIVLEVKRGFDPHVIMNLLYEYTEFKKHFSINNLALVNGIPKQLNLEELLFEFIEHRKNIIERRIEFDLRKAKEKAHVLEGLNIALNNIDEVIKIIKSSKLAKDAKERLVSNFGLSEIQANSVLDMRLQKLTALEIFKLEEELNVLLSLIKDYEDILLNPVRIINIIREETINLGLKFGDERRTKIIYDEEVLKTSMSDLMQKENIVVMLTKKGFLKRLSQNEYKLQGTGGKGLSSFDLNDGDEVVIALCVNTHDYLFMISNEGKLYLINAYEIKDSSRASKGQNISELINLGDQEEILTIKNSNDLTDDAYLLLTTASGKIARFESKDFKAVKSRGVIVIKLNDKDFVTSAEIVFKDEKVICLSKKGSAFIFNSKDVRLTNRGTQGVCGMKLKEGDLFVKALAVRENPYLLIVSENGYGKRLSMAKISELKRGATGYTSYKKSDKKAGSVVDAIAVSEDDEILLVSKRSKVLRTMAGKVSEQGKDARGIQVLFLDNDSLVSVSKFIK
ncbi:DNA topoisomerase (ATP-hydrolyzing) subunit A [Borreliella finlandensis]|uniref:DNA topoisomerase (ATP-hydrolyzing) subunit A n=1 Tax=Borreliella finlandensis TaxID=498741 RepID=UPI0026490213|nr:DNA topoisomerase (ATP-hydrolyzing) subunit A [Borreliella finlandensis]WKC89969.1 DNA topoisomerase (ATP-hydrolyzing) subunit A [Borreliella finlandensis]